MAALAQRDIDELIVCTLPPGLSRWLGTDLVGRLHRATDLPITHIVAPAGMPERVTAQAVRVSIYIGESDRHGHTPLHSEIVQRARAAGLAGATVLHGVEGFGASSVIHTSRLLTMSEDLPVVIIIVDTADHIDGFLPQLEDLITQGLVVARPSTSSSTKGTTAPPRVWRSQQLTIERLSAGPIAFARTLYAPHSPPTATSIRPLARRLKAVMRWSIRGPWRRRRTIGDRRPWQHRYRVRRRLRGPVVGVVVQRVPQRGGRRLHADGGAVGGDRRRRQRHTGRPVACGAWTARGLRVPSRNALLADAVPPDAYGRAYGFERAMDILGAIIGPLLALGLVGVVGVGTAIIVSVVPGLLAAAAIVYAIRHIPRHHAGARQRLRLRVRPGARQPGSAAGARDRAVRGRQCRRHTADPARDRTLLTPIRGAAAATSTALALYVGYNVAATVGSVPAGRVTDRRGSVGVLAAGAGLFAVAYTGLAITGPAIAVLGGCFVLAGVAIGCVETAQHTAVATVAPTEVRGSAFGLLAATQAFGNLIASSVAGLVWTLVSPTAAFAYAAVLTAAACVALLPAVERPPGRRV